MPVQTRGSLTHSHAVPTTWHLRARTRELSVPARDSCNVYVPQKGISRGPTTGRMPTAPEQDEEPLLDLNHDHGHRDCENQYQERIFTKFFLKMLPVPVMH